jgi:hypothetical protein
MAKKAERKRQAEQSKEIRNVLIVASLVAAGVGIYWLPHRSQPASAPTPPFDSETSTQYSAQSGSTSLGSGIPPYFESAEAAKPFPPLVPAAYYRRTPVVAQAYEIASEIPQVLVQQPCYCYCDKSGHRSLLDCYTSDHAAG